MLYIIKLILFYYKEVRKNNKKILLFPRYLALKARLKYKIEKLKEHCLSQTNLSISTCILYNQH